MPRLPAGQVVDAVGQLPSLTWLNVTDTVFTDDAQGAGVAAPAKLAAADARSTTQYSFEYTVHFLDP